MARARLAWIANIENKGAGKLEAHDYHTLAEHYGSFLERHILLGPTRCHDCKRFGLYVWRERFWRWVRVRLRDEYGAEHRCS